MIEDPNVVGKNVTIEANGSIGQDTGSETFKLSELSPETDVDKILLIASAERDNLEIAEDGDTVTVHKREDVDIHADSITLKARDYIYLGGEEDINVNTVEAGEGQKITIAGAKGIYNVATEADHANVIGGDLVLEAADGSIGTEDKALNLKLADGAKVTARSQNDIFLNSTGGDLVAESLLAKDGVLSLTADGSLIAGTLKEGEIVNLQGQSIVVNAENVGDEDNYLTVALGDKENEEHTLTLNVAGDANVNNLGAQELAVESSAVGSGCAHGARHDLGPGGYVLLSISHYRKAAGGAAGGLKPHYILHGGGKKTVGVIVAKVILYGEGQKGDIVYRADILRFDSGGVHFFAVEGDIVVHAPDGIFKTLALKPAKLLARHKLVGFVPYHDGCIAPFVLCL